VFSQLAFGLEPIVPVESVFPSALLVQFVRATCDLVVRRFRHSSIERM
jgi:hypothetical protein